MATQFMNYVKIAVTTRKLGNKLYLDNLKMCRSKLYIPSFG